MSKNSRENIQSIIKAVLQGEPVVIVDNYDRENEADLFIAAERVTKTNLNFLIQNAKGLMCIPCHEDILTKLAIPMMVDVSTDKFGTPFTVSVDAADGTTSGMSVSDRIKTINIFLNPNSKPSDLNRPGHMFPLRANPQLLLGRGGHTEASIELCRLAGLKNVGIICEIIDANGDMMRGTVLEEYIKNYSLPIISLQDIKNYVYA